jgi:hypothetical protein
MTQRQRERGKGVNSALDSFDGIIRAKSRLDPFEDLKE